MCIIFFRERYTFFLNTSYLVATLIGQHVLANRRGKDRFWTLLGGSTCGLFYLLVVLHVQVVLVSVLVAVGRGNDGDGVDGLHQSSLCKSLRHHLTAIVWHYIPEERKKR